jgi:ribosomal protein S18 acetylase RimI-like enzyme
VDHDERRPAVTQIRSTLPSVSELAKPAPSGPTIRRATDTDVLPMAEVHIVSWRETYPGMLPERMLARLSIADEAIRWQRMMDRPRAWGEAISFVADQLSSIVGYGTCGEQRMRLLADRGFTSEISELYVLRRSQRQGVGRELMRAMADALIERGHDTVMLWVLAENLVARQFYESLGGVPIAEKRAGLVELAYGWPDLRRLSSVT